MPGLAGYTGEKLDGRLDTMLRSLMHSGEYLRAPVAEGPPLNAGLVEVKRQGRALNHWAGLGVEVWLFGELYDEAGTRGQERSAEAERLGRGYLNALNAADWRFLRETDGIFAAAIFDARRGELHLVNDRYGLRQLYWRVRDGRLEWASELKAFSALGLAGLRLDAQALADFMERGYVAQERTWWEGIELLAPATALTWSVAEGRLRETVYWRMEELEPGSLGRDGGRKGMEECIEEAERLFAGAVRRRIFPGECSGVTLSGGMDSRLLLLSMPEGAPRQVVTFGRKGGEDPRIAAEVARMTGDALEVVHIGEGDWLRGRVEAVWRTDGLLDLANMHAVAMLPAFESQSHSIHLGYLGDAVAGGTYLSRPPLSEIENYRQPGRRFVWNGCAQMERRLPTRSAFMDYAFFDFCLRLPVEWRRGSEFYNRWMLSRKEKYFRGLEWGKLGMPLGWKYPRPGWEERVLPLRARMRAQWRRWEARLGVDRGYEQYWRWVGREPARSFLEKLLLNGEAVYPQYWPRERVLGWWEEHLQPKRGAALPTTALLRMATVELWLQQLNGRMRTWEECATAPRPGLIQSRA
jgi:asparagine synthase (glutamine-hydrolysing)